ncbi:Zinc finger protein 333-like [Homarus americanus]|uniref:Zinc finger protein 333-like n=2 Tax=Homarus americanus TaxID=6706 RepID=A0A8J5MZD7_HOMAM|nr:Zinc finger protein 333-like [Homarus americanus]
MRVHSNVEPLKREIRKKGYAQQVLGSLNEDYHDCEHCDEQFKSKSKLNEHMRKHILEEPYECEVCLQEIFPTDNHNCLDLQKHDEKYNCPDCDDKYEDLTKCLQHMKNHRGKAFLDCKLCGQVFTHTLSLKCHMNNHKRGKPYTCKVCNKKFGNYGDYLCHKKLHPRNKFYDCVLCPRTFLRPHLLKAHMLQHLGEKHYRCNLCNTMFARKDTHRRHMQQFHPGFKKCVFKLKSAKCNTTVPKKDKLQNEGKESKLSMRNSIIKQENDVGKKTTLEDVLKTFKHPAGFSKKAKNSGLQNESLPNVGASNSSKIREVHAEKGLVFEESEDDIPLIHIGSNILIKCESLSRNCSSSSKQNMSENNDDDNCSTLSGNSNSNMGIRKMSECNICGKVFINDIVRTYHYVRQHISEECNQCMRCGQVFFNITDFMSHQIHHKSLRTV